MVRHVRRKLEMLQADDLCKVHDFHGVTVDGDGAGHCCRGSVLRANAGAVTALPRVVLLLYQVITGPKK